MNLADVGGVRIRYRLGTAEFSIALSALYELLLLNPQRGCSILSGLWEWERCRCLAGSAAVRCRSPTVHRPQAVWQCIAGVAPPTAPSAMRQCIAGVPLRTAPRQ